MQHLKARQTEVTSKWHYTAKHNGRIYPIGDCANHEGHETAGEAEECYKTYLLNNYLALDGKLFNELRRCAVCNEFTDGVATIELDGFYEVLCDEHRTRPTVEGLLQVGESRES